MKKYEYKFVKVNKKIGLTVRNGDTFKEVKKIIRAEAEQGWRFKQVVKPFNEVGPFYPICYRIIFEREVSEE